MSEELKDIIMKLLDKNQKTRLGSQNDADDLVNHPWFRGFDWDGIMSKKLNAPFKPDMEYLAKKKGEQQQLGGNKASELISIQQDEDNDQIPYNQKKLIE